MAAVSVGGGVCPYSAYRANGPSNRVIRKPWVGGRKNQDEVALLASELGFPEGPVVMPDCRRWHEHERAVSRYVHTGGSPWGAIRGIDDAVYLTEPQGALGRCQRSGVPRSIRPLNSQRCAPVDLSAGCATPTTISAGSSRIGHPPARCCTMTAAATEFRVCRRRPHCERSAGGVHRARGLAQ
jgi:hypothetical protein